MWSLAAEWFVTTLWLIWLQLSRTRTTPSDKIRTMRWRKVPQPRICVCTGLFQNHNYKFAELELISLSSSDRVPSTWWGQAAWRTRSSRAPPPPPPPPPCLWRKLSQERQQGREGEIMHSTTSRLAASHGREGGKSKRHLKGSCLKSDFLVSEHSTKIPIWCREMRGKSERAF